jgi:hypothetical protein
MNFEGQVEVSKSGLYFDEKGRGSGPSKLLARIGLSVRPIIDIPQIVEEIRKKAGLSRPARSDNP